MKLGMKTLLVGLYQAVVEAREYVNRQHLKLFESYFEKQGEGPDAIFIPRMVKIGVPHPNGDLEVMNAPESALVPLSSLEVQTLSIEFEARLSGLEAAGITEDGEIPSGRLRDDVKVMLKGSNFLSRTSPAKIIVTFKISEPPEGVALIEEHLLKAMRG